MRRRVLTLGITALAFLALTGHAQAHIVPQGVGSQTWFDFRPSGIRLSYNMGFSSLLGYEYLTQMDTDNNGQVDAVEKRLWLEDFGKKMLRNLEFYVDGERVQFRIVDQMGTGMIGDVSNVAFDTLFTFESDFKLGTKAHKISYYEGNFPNEKAQQYLWLPAEYTVFKTFYHTQKMPISAPLRERGYVRREGRDVSIDLQFNEKAVVEDEAMQKVLIHTKALEAVLAGFEGAVVTESLNEGVNAWAFEEAVFGRPKKKTINVPGPSAELAKSRVPGENDDSGGKDPLRKEFEKINQGERNAAPIADGEATQEIIDALKMINEPFSWAAILTFMFLGAWHARTPGHGKTMVAAYLIGRQGRVADAIKLGLMVTFTHTISLYTIGLTAVFVVQQLYETEEYSSNAFLANVTFWVTLASGLLMIFFGLVLFRQRYRNYKSGRILPEGVGAHDHSHGHTHGHHHPHSHSHSHDHSHDHSHGHDHSHSHDHDHSHDHGHEHSHSHEHKHDHAHSHVESKAFEAKAAADQKHDHDHAHSHDHSHDHAHDHSHDHDHAHGHSHSHDHSHGHSHGHSHSHGHGHSHSHGGLFIHDHAGLDAEEHAKAHADEMKDVSSFKDLMAVAIGGGLVPCPMGVIIIIYSLRPEHQDRMMQCLTYLISFSLGLGMVITGIALVMVLFRDVMARALKDRKKRAFLTFAPLLSAFAITGIGLVLSYEAFDPGLVNAKAYVFGDERAKPVLKEGEDGGAGKRDNKVKKG